MREYGKKPRIKYSQFMEACKPLKGFSEEFQKRAVALVRSLSQVRPPVVSNLADNANLTRLNQTADILPARNRVAFREACQGLCDLDYTTQLAARKIIKTIPRIPPAILAKFSKMVVCIARNTCPSYSGRYSCGAQNQSYRDGFKAGLIEAARTTYFTDKKQAARILDVSPQNITKAIRTGRVALIGEQIHCQDLLAEFERSQPKLLDRLKKLLVISEKEIAQRICEDMRYTRNQFVWPEIDTLKITKKEINKPSQKEN